MMKDTGFEAAYRAARERYAAIGVDADRALEALGKIALSLPCWQGDDVHGFEVRPQALGGGILVTGGSPGCARNGDELRADLECALGLIPGRHRVNLHAIYLESGEAIDRDSVALSHFDHWADWAAGRGLGLDFNPTYFAHPKAAGGLTLSHPDKAIRDFWVAHGLACRRIAAGLGKRLGTPCWHNTWIPDGYKDAPVDLWEARGRLRDSLDAIHREPADSRYEIDAVESKVFGIGLESATVGSHEFYLSWAVQHELTVCLDMGHFHPTESVADKISSVLHFTPSLLLHLSRPVRWDSDHVVVLDDAVSRVAEELVRSGALDRTAFGLDYFDGTLVRPAAWVIGARAVQKALLQALLQPRDTLIPLERSGDATKKLMLLEEVKSLPWSAVWDWFCCTHDVPVGTAWYTAIEEYAASVLARRN